MASGAPAVQTMPSPLPLLGIVERNKPWVVGPGPQILSDSGGQLLHVNGAVSICIESAAPCQRTEHKIVATTS